MGDAATWIQTSGGVLVAIVAGSAALRVIYRHWRRADATLQAVAKEFAPNGGSTMRDAIDRLEAGQAALTTRVERIEINQAGTPPPATTVIVEAPGGSVPPV